MAHRSKPAPHARGLKIGIQPVGKGLVFGRVADEARIKPRTTLQKFLDGRDKTLWQAATPQEDWRQVPGPQHRAMINRAWPSMLAPIRANCMLRVRIAKGSLQRWPRLDWPPEGSPVPSQLQSDQHLEGRSLSSPAVADWRQPTPQPPIPWPVFA